MKAITLYQPWASLILDKRKTVETRSWPTKHRGKLAIHAGNTIDFDACQKFGYDPSTIIHCAIICTVDLVRCVQFPDKSVVPDEYGDFTPGRYGWILGNVKPVDPPIKVKGAMKIWNWIPHRD